MIGPVKEVRKAEAIIRGKLLWILRREVLFKKRKEKYYFEKKCKKKTVVLVLFLCCFALHFLLWKKSDGLPFPSIGLVLSLLVLLEILSGLLIIKSKDYSLIWASDGFSLVFPVISVIWECSNSQWKWEKSMWKIISLQKGQVTMYYFVDQSATDSYLFGKIEQQSHY